MMPTIKIAATRQCTLHRRTVWLRRSLSWPLHRAAAMASAARSDLSGIDTSADLATSARGRKRKLRSPSPGVASGSVAVQSQADSGMQAQPSTSAAQQAEPTASAASTDLPRGQSLKEFVEQWEFRWDLQREAYPWEWGSDGRLSDGPHNIIRYGQGPPKGWRPS